MFVWGLENPYESLELVRDSPKVNVFCAISKKHAHGPYFFDENVTGDYYLHMLQAWLLDRLTANEAKDFHRKLSLRAYLIENLPGRCIGRVGNDDRVLLKWPPRSPHLTLCDFFGGLCKRFSLRPSSAHKRSGIETENFFSVRDCYRRHAAASLG